MTTRPFDGYDRRPRRTRAVAPIVAALVAACLGACVTHPGPTGGRPAAGTGTDRPAPTPTPATPGGTVPPGVTSGGPILQFAPDGTVTSRSLPDKTIALTFDDGPDPTYTPRVLAVLARYHVHATFFEVGSRVDRYPALARQVLAAGNEIGSHTYTHPHPDTVPPARMADEMSRTAAAIDRATGSTPVLVRPPYSSTPAAVTAADLAAYRRMAGVGYLVVLSDLSTGDWRRPGVAAIVKAATPTGGRGAVVLMHDGVGDRSQTVAAISLLIPRLLAQGYRFVTVSEGLGPVR